VIWSPVVGNAGFIVPEPGFLERLCANSPSDAGALLTFR